MTGNNILGRIRSVLGELPNSEKKIGEYILIHPEEVIKMTTSQLGIAAESNSTAVIRLCNRIGVNGFTKLKVNLSAEIVSVDESGYAEIQAEEKISDIKTKLLGNAFKSMEETISLMNEFDIERVVELIDMASIVYVYGIGTSRLVAENMVQKWSKIGKVFICPADDHQLVSMLEAAPKNALFFSISNSGETREIIELIKMAKKHYIKTVGLTQFGQNMLSNRADYTLQTVKILDADSNFVSSSLHAQFIAVDVLFYAYATKDYTNVIEKMKQSREEMNQYKRKS
ncbi:MurR/RpiR family transcriptional regulator [Carnobacterium sp. CS13]|uniref:MurR/RpiR family transcriptional regulator n=1 Tax=Carnobacterium sp. CS13 TaxID=2800128 RepID=UPI00191420E4|nr:MurR/RpiR family transcriptional regulator [Carnobacterium sp. CS13]QQP69501.1 MurR/RpiR family transcriptional regulator [Carnobacterium sp. CS13]